jgi:multiple antibiotic resistance protein
MLLQRFLELIIIIDPFGVIPFLVASTSIPDHFKLKCAKLASIALFVGGSMFTVFGAAVLNAFAVSLASFTLVGGLVLIIVGFNLMQLTPTKLKNDDTTASLSKQLWLIPITFPMLLGPATVTSLIANHEKTTSVIALLMVSVISYGLFVLTIKTLQRLNSEKVSVGLAIFERLVGMIVCSIGVGMIATSLRQLFQF